MLCDLHVDYHMGEPGAWERKEGEYPAGRKMLEVGRDPGDGRDRWRQMLWEPGDLGW